MIFIGGQTETSGGTEKDAPTETEMKQETEEAKDEQGTVKTTHFGYIPVPLIVSSSPTCACFISVIVL